ncbi:hypothetical protein FACS1894140_0710 [Spirochaetia bacterium]|nr:hypothetical protein FACS1894140_0710 [Spirochaetia bacterium]
MHNSYNMMFFHHTYHLNRRHERFFRQGKVLAVILLKGSTTQSELLKIVDSETLSELEKRKLIKHEDCDIFSLTKKGQLFAKRFENFNRHAERFLCQGKVLSAISRKGSITQSELLKTTDYEPQYLSEILSELERQKSIKHGKQDDVFSVTKTGEMKAQRFQIHDLFTRNMSGSLSDEEKDQLTAIIEKLHSNAGGGEVSHFHFHGSHFGFDHRLGHDHHHDIDRHGHTGSRDDK